MRLFLDPIAECITEHLPVGLCRDVETELWGHSWSFLLQFCLFSPFLANFPVPHFEKWEADQPKLAPGKKHGNSEHTNFELSSDSLELVGWNCILLPPMSVSSHHTRGREQETKKKNHNVCGTGSPSCQLMKWNKVPLHHPGGTECRPAASGTYLETPDFSTLYNPDVGEVTRLYPASSFSILFRTTSYRMCYVQNDYILESGSSLYF